MSASEVVSEIRALIAAGKTDAEIYAFIKQPLIGKPAPDFNVAESLLPSKEFASIGLDTFKGQWKVLLWYPLDFTFVCPTEIIAYGDRAEDFAAINTQVIAASCDSKFSHLAWVNTPRSEGGLGSMKIPILADFEKKVATSYGVVIPSGDDAGVTLRGLFIIDPNNVIRQVTINDLPVGRNVDETIRLIKAFQFVEKHGEVCPANWQPGAATMSADPEKSKAYFSKVANN
jgi:peroxiredoxin (alkyl hydroperoxide reductase subunit C)